MDQDRAGENIALAALRGARLRALRDLQAERGLAATLIFAQGSVLGAATQSHACLRLFLDWDAGDQASLMVVDRERVTLLVTSAFQIAAAGVAGADEIVSARPDGLGPAVSAILARAGIPPDRAIGTIGFSEMPSSGWTSLASELRSTAFVDLTPELDSWRNRKEDAEIAALRRAAGLCDLLFDRFGEFLREDRPAWATQRDLEHVALQAGADYCRTWLTIRPEADRPRYLKRECERPPRSGDQVLLGLMLKREGYWGHAIRTGSFQEARPAHLRLHATALAMFEAGLPHFRIGADLREAEEAMGAILARDVPGRNDIFRFRNGHGLGLSYEEPGSVGAFPQYADPSAPKQPASQRIEGPAVFELHPNLFVPGLGGAALGDMVEIGPEGPRRMLATPLEHRCWP